MIRFEMIKIFEKKREQSLSALLMSMYGSLSASRGRDVNLNRT